MRRLSIAILCLLPTLSLAVELPNQTLTPGKANPALTKEVICAPGFRTGPYRHVPLSEKKEVMRRYGLPWSNHKLYEFDHKIPLETGASNDIKNIFPQPWAEAHVKDKLENFAHKCLCEDKLDLATIQQRFMDDWKKFYEETDEATVCQ